MCSQAQRWKMFSNLYGILMSCGKSRVFVETDAHFLISRAERQIIFHFGADEADFSKNTKSIMKHYIQKHKQRHSGQT